MRSTGRLCSRRPAARCGASRPRSSKEYELELASSMSQLAQARAEVLQLDAAEKEGEGEAKPLPGGDDAQKGPSLMIPNSASPLPGQFAWLQAEEDTPSTPASPLLDQPTTLRGEAARYLLRTITEITQQQEARQSKARREAKPAR